MKFPEAKILDQSSCCQYIPSSSLLAGGSFRADECKMVFFFLFKYLSNQTQIKTFSNTYSLTLITILLC